MYRSWQRRKVVWTKEILAFSQEDKNTLLDSIPLPEISSVEEVGVPSNAHSRNKIASWKSTSLGGKATSLLSRLGSGVKMLRGESNLPDANSHHDGAETGSQHSRSNNKFLNAFLIKTIPGGYNSGREYHFRAESLEQNHVLVPALRAAAAAARRKAMARTRFRKSQEMIRQAYDSVFFQFAVAFLIIAVRLWPDCKS